MSPFVRNFLYITLAGIFSAFLGLLFAAVIALISPEFVRELFVTDTEQIVRYAGAIGAILGLFIGAGAMAFVMLVAAVANWFRPKKDAVKTAPTRE